MTGFSLVLRQNPADGNNDIAEVTDLFQSWRHSTRSIGGNWQADGQLAPHARGQMERFFMEALGNRIVARVGGADAWEGQIVRMEYTRNGQTFVRSMERMANAVKVIYSKIGPNLLSLGDVESGSWLTIGTPTYALTTGCTNSPSSWYARGACAMYCLADAANEGLMAASELAVDKITPYTSSVITGVASGVWTWQVIDFDTSDVVAQRATTGCGRTWLQCQMPDTHTASKVNVRLLSSAAGDEVYADGAFLRLAPRRSETKWHEDSDSIAAWGRVEGVILKGEMTDAEADALAVTDKAVLSWPRTDPGDRGATMPAGQTMAPTLTVTCAGLAWTLTWRHARTDGTDQADNHITNLLDESEFFASSGAVIDTNTTEVYLETGNPQPLWRLVEKVAQAGNGAGTSWMAGAYPGYMFRFEAKPTGIQYRFINGRLEYYGGGLVSPLEFEPGWCWMSDMPTEPSLNIATDAGGNDENDPKRVWLDETWFVYENGEMRLEWSLDQK